MGNKPFLLKPIGKDYLWGGNRLNDDFNKGINLSPLAETWECSTHPDGQSLVANIEKPLGLVLKEHPEYLGTHSSRLTNGKPELPILIKLIDAKSDLSVQVHPDDEYALLNESDLGKTEMWYVLDATEEAKLVYGFRVDVNTDIVRGAIQDGSIKKLLNYVPVHKNDVFFIESGTVHAIGAGCLIAEIQESSNVTYRLYDYDRKDKTGKARPLHIEKALDVANLKSSAKPRQPLRVLKYRKGFASELLANFKYFRVERVLFNTENYSEMTDYKTDSNSFHALLCFEGNGLLCGKECTINFFKGDCIFVPADSIDLKIHGKAGLLDISC